MKIEAIIFDMDGLMIDSEPLQKVAMNITLAPFGIELDEQQWISMVGRRAVDNFAGLIAARGLTADAEALTQTKNEAYRRLIPQVPAMPGLYDVIAQVQTAGLPLAVASSSVRQDIGLVLAALGLSDTFEVVLSGEDVQHSKPDPAIYLATAERLGVVPARCLVFEDTVYGVTAAKAAGMVCLAVPGYYTRHQDFSGADDILGSLAEFDLRDPRWQAG